MSLCVDEISANDRQPHNMYIERNSLIVGLSDVEDNVRLNNRVLKRKVTSLFDSVNVVYVPTTNRSGQL